MIDLTKIPHGDYCYDDRGDCPYWFRRKRTNGKRKLGKQENGYCSYLGKGDWDMNSEPRWITKYMRNGEWDSKRRSADEIGIPMSLLWDSVKMCSENTWDDFELTFDLGVYGI